MINKPMRAHENIFQEILKSIGKIHLQGNVRSRTAKAVTEMEADMNRETNGHAAPTTEIDEELIDTLIAISVVAKRLATKLKTNMSMEGERQDEQREGNNHTARRPYHSW